MERVKVEKLLSFVGQKVKIAGFVHEIRDHGNIIFMLLRDASGIIQVVGSEIEREKLTKFGSIPRESVIEIEGTVKKEKQAPKGLEIQLVSFNILSKAQVLPIPVVEKGDEASLSKRLDYRWLDLRKPRSKLIFEIWTFMEQVMREWWMKEGFIQIYSPKLMGVPSESGAELFALDYFGKKAYLAQSPQFYKQMAMAAGFEKVFEIGPAFRANPSHTTRHDTEFTMVDVEISFIKSHEEVMQVEESLLQYSLQRIKEVYEKRIEEEFHIEIKIPKVPFPRISFKEVQKILGEKGHIISGDLDAQAEKMLSEYISETYNHEFVFVTEYPYEVRPFYHMKKEGGLTRSYDLIWKGIEITTGAQREHRPETLREQAIEKGLHLEPIQHYLDFFKYGCPPHGGFGLSPTRLLMLLLGIKNVREVTFLPRDTQRLEP